jgi:hypothetical protein
MSFSDFRGSGKKPTTPASAALANTSGKDGSGVGVISESLLQYQVRPYFMYILSVVLVEQCPVFRVMTNIAGAEKELNHGQ